MSSLISSTRGVAGALRLRLRHLRADDDVAEQPSGRRGVVGAGAQLVHREAEHVGRARLVHPLHVQLLHRGLVDEEDRDVRIRMHVQQVEPEGHEPLHDGLVDGHARLVVHLDAHRCRPSPGRVRAAFGAVLRRTEVGRRPRLRRAPPAARGAWRPGRPAAPRRSGCRRPRSGRRASAGRRPRCVSQEKWMSSIRGSTRVAVCRPEIPFGRSTWVMSPVIDHLRAEAEAGEEHLHLLGRRVLRLVEHDERVVQRAAAHVRERRDLDRRRGHELRDELRIHHLVEGVVERPQVRVDLVRERAGQVPEPLPRLDGGPGQDDAVDLLALQRLHGLRHREVRLAGAGRADAERDRVAGRSPRRTTSGRGSSPGWPCRGR